MEKLSKLLKASFENNDLVYTDLLRISEIYKGQDIDITDKTSLKFLPSVNYETYNFLLNNNIEPTRLLESLLTLPYPDHNNIAQIDTHEHIIWLALTRGASLGKNGLYSIKNLFFNKEILESYIGADKLLNIALESSTIYSSDLNDEAPEEKIKYKKELVEFCIENGADVNFNYGRSYPLDIVYEQEIIDLLKNYGARCNPVSTDEIYEAGLGELLLNPEIIINKKYHNLNAPSSESIKIPSIIHYIWLTSPDSPKEIKQEDIDNIINNKLVFSSDTEAWEHILWTNDKDIIPNSVKTLEEAGFTINSIDDYKDDIDLLYLIENAISEKNWGIASDTLRYGIIKHFGGVYADVNFTFKRHIGEEIHKYDFLAITFHDSSIDNYFFAASKAHPIIEKVINLVEKNLVSPPKYISSVVDYDIQFVTDKATALPLSLAYYLEANKNGNCDVIYPTTEKDILEQAAQKEYELSLELDLLEKCPELEAEIYLNHYLNEHEICGLTIYDIGYNSKDGLTWLE